MADAVLVGIALCWCLVPLQGQAAPSRSLRFEHLDVEENLSQESVVNILQDRQGFMWFGTQAGLSRYDGYKMTVFKNDPVDPASIPDNYVSASYEDSQGRLWFGTKGGLARFDPASQSFTRYEASRPRQGAPGNRMVAAIVPDGTAGLWLASGEGLLHLDFASGAFTRLSMS